MSANAENESDLHRESENGSRLHYSKRFSKLNEERRPLLTSRNPTSRFSPLLAVAGISLAGVALTAHYLGAQTADGAGKSLDREFEHVVKPFFKKNCMACHNSDVGTAGIRVDQLDANLEDRQIPTWEAIRNRLKAGTMPPKGLPQPTQADRQPWSSGSARRWKWPACVRRRRTAWSGG